MTVTRGPKGKYFTDVIRKKPLRARIRTQKDLIEGVIHIHPDKRPLDEINEAEGFLAVTEAVIYLDDQEIRSDFVAVNLDGILWVQPLDEVGDDHE